MRHRRETLTRRWRGHRRRIRHRDFRRSLRRHGHRPRRRVERRLDAERERKGMIAVIYAEATAIDCAVIRTAWPVGHFTLLARRRSEGEPTTIGGFYSIGRGCARIGCKAGACRCGVRRRRLLLRSRPKERYQVQPVPLRSSARFRAEAKIGRTSSRGDWQPGRAKNASANGARIDLGCRVVSWGAG